jgi:hypothetical protein
MQKFITSITIVLLFLSFPVKPLHAQVTIKTGIGTYLMCYHTSKSMPVVVQNMIGVDSLKLVLAFDNGVVDFVESFAIHSALAGGTFNATNQGDSITLSWHRKNAATIFNDTLVWVKFKGLVGSTNLSWKTSGSFYHTVSGNSPVEFIDGGVTVSPEIKVLLTEIDPTCAAKHDANYMANAFGGTGKLTYLWNGLEGRFDSIQTDMSAGANIITITDSWGCKLDSLFYINGLPGANVKLIIEGNEDTTIYLQNPVLTFSFEEIPPTHVVVPPLWEFGDGDTIVSFNPTHVYARANVDMLKEPYYTLKLHVRNENGCDSIIEVTIPIKDVKLKIPGVITPNADGNNDVFMILNENKNGSSEEIKITNEFQHMELVIFDRWGRKIYDDSNYQSDWTGKGVPDGAYYFKLKTVGFYNTETYKGSLLILGGSSN